MEGFGSAKPLPELYVLQTLFNLVLRTKRRNEVFIISDSLWNLQIYHGKRID